MDSSGGGVWAFYYIQGEDGEDRSHPNAYKIPVTKGNDITLADVHRHFPLKDPSTFHFRFRLNSNNKAGTPSTFFWLDITNPTQKIPLLNGRVICKLLRLNRPNKPGLVFKRKPLVKASIERTNSGNQHRTATSQQQSSSDQRAARYSDTPSSHGAESPRATVSRQASGITGTISEAPKPQPTPAAPTPSSTPAPAKIEESFEDFLSGGGGSSSSTSKPAADLMGSAGWSDGTSASSAKPASAANSFLNSMDPLAPGAMAVNKPTKAAPSQSAATQPKFEDDGGQTVGPVTMAEMKKYSTTTSDGSNVYNPDKVDKSTKSEEVRRAMEERERQKYADIEKARAELRQREEAAKMLDVQKQSAGQLLGPKLKAWAEDNGRVKNIRTLLSTMHTVMWEESKWQEVNMGKLINPPEVKKHYRKAMIVVHPDKAGGRNAEQLLIAERVFAAVNTAWDEFVKTNPC
jgi:hypothetical protein